MFNRSYSPTKKSHKGKVLIGLIGILCVIFIGYGYMKNFMVGQEVNQEINELELEISQLEVENAKLDELTKYFDSQAYAELKARSELGLQKPDENVVIIEQDSLEDLKIAANDFNLNNNQNMSNPEKWFRLIFVK